MNSKKACATKWHRRFFSLQRETTNVKKKNVMETKKRMTRKLDLLTAVEQIVELSKESHLDAEFFKKAARPIKYLAERLELTKEQCVMMALFIDNSNDTSIKISDFARYLECSTTRVIRLMSGIDELERRGLVCCCRDRSGVTYRVPWEVVEAFKRDEKYTPRDNSGLNCAELFSVIEEIMAMREEKELSTETAIMRLQQLLESNKHLLFVQKLKSFRFGVSDESLLLVFSHLFVNNNDDNIGYHDLSFFFDFKAE